MFLFAGILYSIDLLRFVKGRYHSVQGPTDCTGVILFQRFVQNCQLLFQLSGTDGRLALDENLAVLSLLNVPAGDQELLV